MAIHALGYDTPSPLLLVASIWGIAPHTQQNFKPAIREAISSADHDNFSKEQPVTMYLVAPQLFAKRGARLDLLRVLRVRQPPF